MKNVYPFFQQETQLFEVAFLLEKSVCHCILLCVIYYVRVSDPGAPGKMDRLIEVTVVFVLEKSVHGEDLARHIIQGRRPYLDSLK